MHTYSGSTLSMSLHACSMNERKQDAVPSRLLQEKLIQVNTCSGTQDARETHASHECGDPNKNTLKNDKSNHSQFQYCHYCT